MGERLLRHGFGLTDNRQAFAGGLAGTLLAGGLLYVAFAVAGPTASANESADIPFVPATLLALGEPDGGGAAEPQPEPLVEEPPVVVEPPIIPEPTVEPTPTDAVTTSEKPRPQRPKPRPPKPVVKPVPRPPGPGNTDDPFGDRHGLRDLERGGDPWAKAVLDALNDLQVGTFGGEADGDLRFTIKVCKDGSIKAVKPRGGSVTPVVKSQVISAVKRVRLPPPPRHIRKLMASKCEPLGHTFRWHSD